MKSGMITDFYVLIILCCMILNLASPFAHAGQSIHWHYGIIVIAVLILILDTMMIIEKVAELVGVILLWEFYFIKSYFTSILNWLEIPLSVIGRRCQCPTMWQWEIGVVAVFLVWFDLIFILRKFQIFNVGKI